VSVAARKIVGVESATVTLEGGKASIVLKPGNSVTLEQLRQAVEKNGFTPQAADVTVRGQLETNGKAMRLRVTGTDAVYDLAGETATLAALSGKTVELQGDIAAPKEKTLQRELRVRTSKLVQ